MEVFVLLRVCAIFYCFVHAMLSSPCVQEPPVGPLPFKKPVPLLSHSSIVYAVTNPPACPQYSLNPYPWCINTTDKSEDGLYLNIWTPADAGPTNKKAVLYWIHGGAFRYGSIRDELYSRVPLASLGDIIVVTVNYRLGSFGFLSSASVDAPGNVGYELNQYLGVPYAQPPVGPLRFKKPVPLSKYPSVFYAFTNPPACHQYSLNPYPWYVNTTDQSEDCLYLNIWTPADASPVNKKAVMYWMYGGSFRYGSIRDKLYSGVPLAALGDIIVVTVNYRLGSLGFLTSGSDDAPGNVGLWDVLEGLKWVNKHIEAFGGDLSRITISGESAGSITFAMFSTSPLTKGLYSRMIMQSGSPVTRYFDDNKANIKLGQKLAKSLECANDTYTIETHPEEVVQCLRGVDAVTLSKVDALVALRSSPDFGPQYGDELLPNNQRTSIMSGAFSCVDLLIGNNKDEGSILLSIFYPELYGFYGEKNPHVSRALGENTILAWASLYPNPQSIVDHYLPANLTDDSHYRIRQQSYTAIGDLLLRCPTTYYAQKCAEQRKNVYYYVFAHRPSVTPWAEWMGATHFEELQFVFGQPVLHQEKYLPSEAVLSLQMIDIWTSFVKYGEPNVPWPLYSREDPAFKYIGPEYVTGTSGEGGPGSNCDFLRPFYEF